MSNPAETLYRCGTLTYTRRALVVLFVWLLWGDFCITFMTRVTPVVVPLMLKAHSASNFVIGLLCGSIPALLNFIVNPILSTASDRTRSRWGRRIPYMLFAVPFVSLFLILLGFSDQIGTALAHFVNGPQANPTVFILGVLAFFSVAYTFFDLFAGCVYYYIFNDVVPEPVVGRFLGYFRMVGSVGGLLFNLAVMPCIQTHMALICVIVGVLYFLGFGTMCLKVKEGEYPPPPPPGKGMLHNVAGYFRDCFSVPFWLMLFLGWGLNRASIVCRSLFNLLYAMENLHISSQHYGWIMAAYSITTMVLAIPVGYLCDKFHPLRVYIVGAWLVVMTNIYGFFFCSGMYTFLSVTLLLAVVYTIQDGSGFPLLVRLYPKEQFGQFSSASSMVRAFCMVAANAAGGWFIDLLGYQYIFVWDVIFTVLTLIIFHWIYREWKKRGGDENYVPPTAGDKNIKTASLA